jgi:hypothetical protein
MIPQSFRTPSLVFELQAGLDKREVVKECVHSRRPVPEPCMLCIHGLKSVWPPRWSLFPRPVLVPYLRQCCTLERPLDVEAHASPLRTAGDPESMPAMDFPRGARFLSYARIAADPGFATDQETCLENTVVL